MPIINEKELLELDPSTLLLVDTRNVMGNEEKTNELLRNNPIKHTIHIPEHPFIVEEGGHNNGRSPVPTKGVVKGLYDSLKSTGKDIVLFSDDKSFFHTRLYVVFKLYGYDVDIYIGSLDVLKKVAEKVEDVIVELPREFENIDELPDSNFYTTLEEVEENLNDNNHLLIDVRASSRYLGEGDHLDSKSGHIPTAINIENRELFKDGNMSLDVLQDELEDIKKFDKVTVSCGSGMSATPMFTFLDYHGVPVKLYGGSFSEWVREGKYIVSKETTLKERVSDIE